MHQEFLLRSNLVDKRCRIGFLHCDCIFTSLAQVLDVGYFSFFQGDMGPQGAAGEKGEQGERVMMMENNKFCTEFCSKLVLYFFN